MTKRNLSVLICICVAIAGCSLNRGKSKTCATTCCVEEPLAPSHCGQVLNIDEPCLDDCSYDPWMEDMSPNDIDETALTDANSMKLSLQECVTYALANSRIMRDLGGTVLRNPDSLESVYGPAMAFTNPRTGEEAALSDFDAQLFASAIIDKNDREFNNNSFGNSGDFRQDFHDYEWGITKTAATGTQYTLRHITQYDKNNSLGLDFPDGSFDSYIDAEIRQPLFQGAGSEFNRIAGPNSGPGQINGVLIGRIRADISLADFESSIRDLVSNVENAYWDLYFTYRDLAAKIEARDAALKTWQIIARNAEIVQGTPASDESQAREQYFRFQSEVIDALNGRLVDSTRTNNGTAGGTFRSSGGVRMAERRLRLMVGMKINDGRLIQPTELPTRTPIEYDWVSIKSEALAGRPELRKQRWEVKQQELELVANKNFLMPRVDAIARYRQRGYGRDLFNHSNGAMANIFNGGREEWQVGVELSVPLGYRRAHSAVRHSELGLARERAVLKEQERTVIYGLSNAVGDVKRAYQIMLTQYNRLSAVDDQVRSMEIKREKGIPVPLDVLLEAQRRRVDTRIRYHQSEIEYSLALKNVHYEKGSLLTYNNVMTSEARWSGKAYQDANERDNLRGEPIDKVRRDPVVSIK
ncbi:MAG: outer membrane protein TolC [Pirellulaceae bacterium]|jgi:outer membrane protein TolC